MGSTLFWVFEKGMGSVQNLKLSAMVRNDISDHRKKINKQLMVGES